MASEKIMNFVEEIKKLSVLELSELVDAIQEEFGVTAAVAAAPAAGAAGAAACSRAAVDGAAAGDLQHRRAGGIQSADEQHPERDGLDRGHASEQPAVRSCRTAGICRSRGSSHRMGKNGHAAPADEPDERAAGHPDLFQECIHRHHHRHLCSQQQTAFCRTGQKIAVRLPEHPPRQYRAG